MKKIMTIIKNLMTSCPVCFGTGNKELPNGSVIDCPMCKGKGYL